MAPEQWQALPDIDGRADLYSLGIILFRCLLGRLPFSAPSPYAWMEAHLHGAVPALEGVEPPALVELTQRLLSKRREDRPASAEEVLREVQRISGEPPSLTLPTARAPAPTETVPARGGRRWTQVLGILGLLVGGGLLWRYSHPARPAGADAGARVLAPAVAKPAVVLDAAPSPVAASPGLERDLAVATPPAAPSKPAAPENRKRAPSKRGVAPLAKPAQDLPDVPKQPESPPKQKKYEPIY